MSDDNTQQPRRLSHEEIVARLKSTSVHPMASEMIPPMGLNSKPTFVPGHPGIQAYFWIVGMAIAGVPQNASPEEVADYAIAVADTLFDKLALKFELLQQPKGEQ